MASNQEFGVYLCLILGTFFLMKTVLFNSQKKKEPKLLSKDDQIDLITGKRESRVHSNGRSIWVNEEDSKYSIIKSQYQIAYMFAQVKPNQEFQMAGEICTATPEVIEGSKKTVLSIRQMCQEKYNLDIHYALFGVKSEDAPV